ncbi:hypothetical protein EVAR_29252_1 [Eumeta japonica]|uniref:Uncharacterized protein n=1 Tax=Eumeta variegata TaxID=151549 RepID=A0A4C1VGR8_EUMVA|nr:hypothetical protein EVAR_29252_1 [Eumeta japonica]
MEHAPLPLRLLQTFRRSSCPTHFPVDITTTIEYKLDISCGALHMMGAIKRPLRRPMSRQRESDVAPSCALFIRYKLSMGYCVESPELFTA